MSLIVSGNKIMQSKSIGYELIDDAPLEVIYSVENWVRPTEWIPVPTPATGSEVVSILYGVYEYGPNFLSIQAAGAFSVNWGDGSFQTASAGSSIRKEFLFGSYSSGTLTSDGFRQALVTVTPNTPGTFTSFNLNGRHSYQSTNSYEPTILEIKMSGSNLTSIGSFTQFDRLSSFEFVGTHSIASLASVFSGIRGLRKIKMNCQGVTNTSSMFSSSINLREVEISNLHSSTNMSNMFSSCYSLNTLPIIDTESCLNMSSMFDTCVNLEEGPNFSNTSNVVNMTRMFQNCYILKRINSFTSSYVTDMSYMFNNCYLLHTIPLLDTQRVSNFNYTFAASTGYGMQLQYIPALNTASASNMSYMFSNCKSLASDRRTKGIPFMNTSRATNMSYMFNNCVKIKTIPQFDTQRVSNFNFMFQGCILLSEVPLFNTASASSMDSMFQSCRVLQTVPLFNTQNVKSFLSMFRYCFELNEVPSFNMATASDVSFMFDCIYSYEQPGGSLYTIPNFNFSSTIASINMQNFLSGQALLEYIPQINTSRATNTNSMFHTCRSLKEVPALNMPLTTTTVYMFRECYNLRKVGALNMPKNTTMAYMFWNCYNLQYIESISTTNALTVVREAFRYCYKITQIPVFDTSNITTGDSFYYVFADCRSLQFAPALNTANAFYFQNTFQNCESLTAAPNWNTAAARDMSNMFQSCTSLEQVPSYNIQNVTSLSAIFAYCSNLVSVTFSNISATNNVNMQSVFYDCVRLRSVSLPSIRISNPASMFWGCSSLTNIGTFSVVTVNGGVGGSQGYYAMFNGCSQLTNLKGFSFTPIANEFRLMFNGCSSLKETPYFSMTASSDPAYQTNTFTGCGSLSKINVSSFRWNITFQGCNLDYNMINSLLDSLYPFNMALSQAGYRTLNFLDNPGLPEMMNFYNRKKVYDKGYTYSVPAAGQAYTWNDLRHYVDAGSTYSYPGTGPTFSDVSGFTFDARPSPTFSSFLTSTVNGTLVNSPVFSTNNFTFNGINQAIVFGTASTTSLSIVTLFAVIEPISLPVGATVSIFGRYDASGRDNYFLDFTDQKLRFGFRQSGTTARFQRVLSKTFNVGEKYFIVARHQSSSNSCMIWVNGVRETSFFSDNITSQIMDQVSTSFLSIGGNYAANNSYANIKVYTAGIYNRLLDDWQVEELQSFFKKKYIL